MMARWRSRNTLSRSAADLVLEGFIAGNCKEHALCQISRDFRRAVFTVALVGVWFRTGMRITGLLISLVILVNRAAAAGGDLIVEHVPAELLAGTNPPAFTTVVHTPEIQVESFTTNRWEKFETEFGIQKPSRSPIKNSLQNAKYQLDRTSLQLQEFVDTVTDRLRFNYGLSDLGFMPPAHRSTGNFITDLLSQTRLKSDIDLKLGKKTFVGVKLVLPIGD